MGRSAEGRSPPVEQSVGTGVPTHIPGPALSNTQQGVPPYQEQTQTDCWQMTLLHLQMLPQPPPRRAWPMNVERRCFLYAPPRSGTSSADRVWDVVWPTTLRGT